jgi:hypothetical protein
VGIVMRSDERFEQAEELVEEEDLRHLGNVS